MRKEGLQLLLWLLLWKEEGWMWTRAEVDWMRKEGLQLLLWLLLWEEEGWMWTRAEVDWMRKEHLRWWWSGGRAYPSTRLGLCRRRSPESVEAIAPGAHRSLQGGF
jgi:hypothetical protein